MTVSLSPPLLLTITAQPLDEASKLVLPKGSSHLEQVTAILDFSYNFKISSWLIKPCLINLSWWKSSFSLGSSPATWAYQFLCLSRILIIDLPNKSYPLAEFNLPTKVIIFFFLIKLIFFLFFELLIFLNLFLFFFFSFIFC